MQDRGGSNANKVVISQYVFSGIKQFNNLQKHMNRFYLNQEKVYPKYKISNAAMVIHHKCIKSFWMVRSKLNEQK